MIPKEKLLNELTKLAETQRVLIPMLNRHVSASVGFSGLSRTDCDEMVNYFEKCALRQAQHLEALTELSNQILESEQNVF